MRSRRLRAAAIAGLVLAIGVVVYALASGPASSAAPRFRSRPDLAPPALQVTGSTTGLVFMAPKATTGQSGPEIVDGHGGVVWFHPLPKGTIGNDFKLQRYRSQPVLTWWQGKTNPNGYGQGEWIVADRSYRTITVVKAGNGLQGDLHDMQLTDQGTALITIYHAVPADLSSVGSSAHGSVVDSIIQEVDVATGAVRFEWHSLDHVALTASHAGPPAPGHSFPYDYFHINSIDVDSDGNLLVSARNTWTIYKLDRKTGAVIWELGGKHSDFALGPGVAFAWQHDARRQPDGTITLFDNEATPTVRDHSRVLTLNVDEARRTVTVKRALTHPDGILSVAEGDVQPLAGGSTFVGWGLGRRVSEFDARGKLTFDVRLPGDYDTYRAFDFAWDGQPATPPALTATRDGGRVTAYASWNGATDVTRWQLLAGPGPGALRPVATAPRSGFETSLSAQTDAAYVAVRALAGERVLATSAPVKVG
jgi:hypothetical protein